MKILMFVKYPPIQGGVSADSYWTAQYLAEKGHEIEVVTNAFEVEETYRIHLTPEDQTLLTGYRIPNLIKLHSSYIDREHRFIPQNNPSLSKLTGIGLRIVQQFQPDLIWAHYVEPYGIAALLISKLTGIPYVIRHAGSDLGRLMLTEQLEPLYIEVFKQSLAVMTGSFFFPRFKEMGVREDQLVCGGAINLPEDLFYPPPCDISQEIFTLGIYGKTGLSKGTFELLEALAMLKSEGFPCKLKALWNNKKVLEKVKILNIAEFVSIENYIPHWSIPAFIWSCDAILFLENNFSISSHAPSIPLEALCCGRPLLTTEEIEQKQSYLLKRNKNCMVIPSSPLTPQAIAQGIKDLYSHKQSGLFYEIAWPNSQQMAKINQEDMENLISTLKEKIALKKPRISLKKELYTT